MLKIRIESFCAIETCAINMCSSFCEWILFESSVSKKVYDILEFKKSSQYMQSTTFTLTIWLWNETKNSLNESIDSIYCKQEAEPSFHIYGEKSIDKMPMKKKEYSSFTKKNQTKMKMKIYRRPQQPNGNEQQHQLGPKYLD